MAKLWRLMRNLLKRCTRYYPVHICTVWDVQTPCKYTSIVRFGTLACFGKPGIFQNSIEQRRKVLTSNYRLRHIHHSHNLILCLFYCMAPVFWRWKWQDHDAPSDSDDGRFHRRRSESSSRSSLADPEQDDSTAVRSTGRGNNTASAGSFLWPKNSLSWWVRCWSHMIVLWLVVFHFFLSFLFFILLFYSIILF